MADQPTADTLRSMTGDITADRSSELHCPRCGAEMVRRERRSDRSGFWGCPNYPRCRGTRPLEAIGTVRPHDPPSTILALSLGMIPFGEIGRQGASARATYERRLERHRARVRDARPRILFFGFAMVIVGVSLLNAPTSWSVVGWPLVFLGVFRTASALFVEPPQVRAWAIGAGGEERLGSMLDSLEAEGFVVLHDLRVPNSRENIDHLLIGPPGVFVIETKTYRGTVRMRGGGLYIGGRRKTGFLDQVERQIDAVSTALETAYVSGYICVLGGDFPWFGRPHARGIEVTPPRRMLESVRAMPPTLTSSDVGRLAQRAERGLRR